MRKKTNKYTVFVGEGAMTICVFVGVRDSESTFALVPWIKGTPRALLHYDNQLEGTHPL